MVRQSSADIWTLHSAGCYIVDPTNACVTRAGENVMGAGISLDVKRRWPEMPRLYGGILMERVRPGVPSGRTPAVSDLCPPLVTVDDERRLCLAPVKADWRDRADLGLIAVVLAELAGFVSARHGVRVAIPRLGCGAGGRDWESEVKPLVREALHGMDAEVRARVIIVSPRA